jgi:hypothetical protein
MVVNILLQNIVNSKCISLNLVKSLKRRELSRIGSFSSVFIILNVYFSIFLKICSLSQQNRFEMTDTVLPT